MRLTRAIVRQGGRYSVRSRYGIGLQRSSIWSMVDFMVLERKSRKSDGQGHADRDATSARVLREESATETADRQPQPGLTRFNDLPDEARDVSGIGAKLITPDLAIALKRE